MNLYHTLRYQENYIRENNFQKTGYIICCCCELNFYKNTTNYLQQFICYFYKK